MPPRLTKPLDAPQHEVFLGMLNSAIVFFQRHLTFVNELNVFPVPDGDTGTNMLGTLKGIQSKLELSNVNTLEEAMKEASHAALMEGRGNSGIILSQVFRGLYEGFDFKRAMDINNLSAAITKATERAYAAVGDPVEGTMLTVLTDISGACNALKDSGTEICNVFRCLTASAASSVDRTTNKLNVLKEAGVVDSGGYGLEIVLRGMELFFSQEDPVKIKINPRVPNDEGAGIKKILETHVNDHDEFGYCTQMTLESSFDYEYVINTFKDMGTSTVIIGEAGLYRIHIHTETPQNVLVKASEIGVSSKVSVENMENQSRAVANGLTSDFFSTGGENESTSLVALVSGSGVGKLFVGSGTLAVLDSSEASMPSVAEILNVVEKVTAQDVICLPNNKNAIPAATEAAKLSKKNVMVLPTENLAEGLECAAEFESDLDIKSNFRNMTELLPFVKMIAIFSASRTSFINGIKVSKGEILAMQDGVMVGSGGNAVELLISSIRSVKEESDVIITVLTREPEQSMAFSKTVDRLTESFGALDQNEIEVHAGEQAHYDFLVSVLFE